MGGASITAKLSEPPMCCCQETQETIVLLGVENLPTASAPTF